MIAVVWPDAEELDNIRKHVRAEAEVVLNICSSVKPLFCGTIRKARIYRQGGRPAVELDASFPPTRGYILGTSRA